MMPGPKGQKDDASLLVRVRSTEQSVWHHGFGLKINERVPLEIPPQKYDLKYMRTKQEKMGHIFKAINL